MRQRDQPTNIVFSVFLAALTLGTFYPAVYCGFINYDDPHYVTANARVLAGLSADNIGWAFRSTYFANWLPLTWISHMLDVTFYGLNPAGHHLTSVIFHAANAIILFLALSRMSGSPERSVMVSALFAVHPLHVESVAWISERKDVLSTFFAFLSLLAYGNYALAKSESSASPGSPVPSVRRRNAVLPYVASLLCFALALMSKIMVATLPFIFLLLDYWPLQRWGRGSVASDGETQETTTATRAAAAPPLRSTIAALVIEKVPFLLLACAACVGGAMIHQGAASAERIEKVSLMTRLIEAPSAYCAYLRQLFWPVDLAVFYPRLVNEPLWRAGLAMFLLLGLTAAALRYFRRAPFFVVGWFWFLGGLLPVTALLQIGTHNMADRNTYVPLVGLLIVIVWAVAELAGKGAGSRWALWGGSAAALLAFAVCARQQIGFWKSSRTLMAHAVEVTSGNVLAHNNLGTALEEEGDFAGAERQFEAVLKIDPQHVLARLNLAVVLARQQKTQEAIDAIANVGLPRGPEGHRFLGSLFREQGKLPEAIAQYSAALALDANDHASRELLGAVLCETQKCGDAVAQFEELAKRRPDARSHFYLGVALAAEGKPADAISHYRESMRLQPDWAAPVNELAWLLATSPAAEIRNGTEAVSLAEQACRMTSYKDARCLGTLDAAYAEAGRFSEAGAVAEQVRSMLQSPPPMSDPDQIWRIPSRAELANAAAARIELYKAGKPYHQPAPP